MTDTGKVSAAVGKFTNADFLKTSGTNIRNNSGMGDIVYLRGTNAGGWLVQEEWMNPTNAPDQKTMMDTFTSRFGATARDELIAVYEDNYWTEADFDNCANMGMSVIRLPFTYMNLVDDNHNLKTNAFARLDWFVENCAERGIYVILDLHGAFGSQNGMDHSGEVNDGYQLYWNDYNRNKTVWLWEQLAEHYKGNPAVAGYDILNEPGPKAGLTGKDQWDFYDVIYDAIRAIDADHIIIMESCWNPSDLPSPSTYSWTNVMYEYHYYDWDHVTDAEGQKTYTNQKVTDVNNANYGVPTFVGEFTCFGEESAWNYAISTYNNNGWHWTSWAYKSVSAYGSWGIYNHNPEKVDIYNDSYDTIKQKWSTVGANNSWLSSNSMVYNQIKNGLPGTVTPAEELTDADFVCLRNEGTGQYVCADNYGEDPLIADRDTQSQWEQFRIIENADGTISLQARANGKFVCAVIDENNQLLARSSAISDWEKFIREDYNNGQIALKAVANNKYVQSNATGDKVLYASSDANNGAWETFTVHSAAQAAGDIDTSTSSPYDGYNLVWSDEFEGTSLDRTNWTYEIGTGDSGWGNNEYEYYTDRTENVSVANGNLAITARKEDYNGSQYTSGRIKTQGLQAFKYGIVEARMKLPKGQGLWPAFWMLGTNITSVGWPNCGEIDIMEYTNSDDHAIGTIHWFNQETNSYSYYTGQSHTLDVSEYHTYSVEWTDSSIIWYIDGIKYHEANTTINGTEEFQEPHFIILNLAVGGNLPGFDVDNNLFPTSMYVDYVRVYQKGEGGTDTPTNPPVTPTGTPDLIVTDIKTDPASPTVGDNVTFTATVKNQGDGAVPAGTITGVRFSVDGLDNQPFTWDDTYMKEIPAGASVNITATGGGIGNTWTATEGNHTIFAWVDDQGRISNESNTGNNTMQKQITVSVAEPEYDDYDIMITSSGVTSMELYDGDATYPTAVIRNIGNKTAPAGITVTLYVDGREFDTVTLQNELAANSKANLTSTKTWTSVFGTHRITAMLNEDTAPNDTDNSNDIFKKRVNVIDG